ncbi:MAG: T9SS type A sorting domain-containing protein [Bacteroidetes bacterium]|nr:T9SS type A sorting domain-containing protein [Bacteroidota bacterium]
MKKDLLIFLLFFINAVVTMANGHTITISKTNVTCNGMSNGLATATVSGGVGPFVYSWTPTGGTDATAANLSANTYTVTVTDQSDLSTVTASVSISQPSPLTITTSIGNTTLYVCAGDCVTLTTATTGGSPTYIYYWLPSGAPTSSAFLCPTTTTTYTVTVTDGNNCSAIATPIIAPISPPSVTINGTTTICNGSNTTLTANGGSTYMWNTGETTASIIITPTTTTTYSVTTTNIGCEGTASIQVTVSCTGIEEQTNAKGIVKIFPNPFDDNTSFTIQSNKVNEKYLFELVDVLGKQVKAINEFNSKQFQVSRDGLQNGIYFYKVYTSESIIGIGKLVVK